MCDGERERRAERVHRPEEVRPPGQEGKERDRAREDDERQPRGAEAGVQAPEDLRKLAVARHRIGDAGGADHAGVRRDEENGGREDADVDLEPVLDAAGEPEVLDDAEDRVVREPALLGRKPEERHPVAVALLVDREGRERDQRQREVDGEDRGCDQLVGVGNVARRITHLFREIGDRLHPRIGQHGYRDRDGEVVPGRGDAPVHVALQDLRAENEDEADNDEQRLGGEVDDRQEDVHSRRLLDADDVDRDEHDDDDRAPDDVPGVLAERSPEDREVVGHEEGRDRDRGDVDEHLRPGGPEADELVEPVPGEARAAARLRIANRSLRVGRRRRGEDHAGDDEDQRRQAERERGRDAERVVDRGADVAVRGREQRGGPQHPLEGIRPAAARRHRRILSEGPVRSCPKESRCRACPGCGRRTASARLLPPARARRCA